ncbi:MAG: Fe-S cluster assembly sulfur transfer protein SufU [Pseudomonadota bacterium]
MLNATPPLDELYREVVLEHHRHPRGAQPLRRVDARAEGKNPSCGDEVAMQLMLEDGRIVGLEVVSQGCAISTASGSMLAERLQGRTLAEARRVADVFKAALHGDRVPAEIDLGDLEALIGVQKFPVRIRCALLPWVTLLEALLDEQGAPPSAIHIRSRVIPEEMP